MCCVILFVRIVFPPVRFRGSIWFSVINEAYFDGHGVVGESFELTCFFAIGEDGNCDGVLSSGELIF